ncbi:Thioredoxin [Sanguibacter gelidistatuariae]|uniref:Thioredoxin n=1 Tax=Sanguibacter gelidistatuariae TaxID=1814289 RepID=A0A1G6JC21_9MICO|nr:thioredoxin family protein [Sanguibacter gelidistatuariae]SDC16240.1 Thioredoxin [Sanguibacter gelidistatuariae]
MDLVFGSPLGRAAGLVALLAVTSLLWFVASRRSGTMRASAARADDPRLDLAGLGAVHGSRATFVQFSSEVCAPCRQVARVLTDLSTREDGVSHVEIDVGEHPDLVRTHGVLRTPTVFLLGPSGSVHGRTSGPMTPGQARDALAALDSDAPGTSELNSEPHGRTRGRG